MGVGGCFWRVRAGLTLERCSQSAVSTIQAVSCDASAVWLVEEDFSQVRSLFRAPNWCLPGGGGTQEAGGTVAESLIVLYRVNTHQIRRGRRAVRSSTSQGSDEPLCAKIKGANREVSEGEADL